MKKIMVTSTNIIEGKPIIKYFDPISANVVIGTNIFSDISASFSDLFGGRASVYEKKLEKIYEQVKLKLKEKAISLSANCIVGFRIDLDEISGKGSQMFMITASGTSVVIESVENGNANDILRSGLIDGEYVENKVNASKYLTSDKFSTDEHLKFAIDTGFIEFLPTAFNTIKYLVTKETISSLGGEEAQKRINNLYKYFDVLDESLLSEKIYIEFNESNSTEYLKQVARLVAHMDLFDYEKIKEILLSSHTFSAKMSLWLLSKAKSNYSLNDIEQFKILPKLIENRFPILGEVMLKKKTLLSAEKEVWKCPCGQTNDLGTYCTSCEKDIYGFTLDEIKPKDAISRINSRLFVVQEYYSS